MVADNPAKRKNSDLFMCLTGLLIFLTHGCSAKQGYVVLQDWQRQQCSNVADSMERELCFTKAKRTYEEYINSEGYKKGTGDES